MPASAALSEPNRVVGITGVAFGAAALIAPRTLLRLYGMDASTADTAFLARMWGTRTAAMGAFLLLGDSDSSRRLASTVATAVNGVDAAVALAGPGLSSRTRVMVALTSGGLAALTGSALTA